jgi:CheY-like chemotaxis protein
MPRILLVEDDETNRAMFRRRLERAGYTVGVAGDGAEALARAAAEPPDLVVMDLGLPVLDGWEATRRLKAADATRDIPVIALTAHAMAGDREKAVQAGCDDYETKPVEMGRFLAKVEALLARRGVPVAAAPPPPAAPPPAPDRPPEPAPAPPTPAAAPTPAGRILVVEDNLANREMLRRRLVQQGYAVGTAGDGRQALDQVRGGGFDLVLLDIMMPELDGYQVLERMKADAATRDIPVIMISALDAIESVVRCIEAGADHYLFKPFDPVLLQAGVSACLEKKRLRDQELEYLRNVATLTAAAGAVEKGEFDLKGLDEVARRPDALGQLARMFQSMAREVAAREERLRQQMQQLRVEIDDARKAKQVAEITGTDYFQDLQSKARSLRERLQKG